MAPPVPAMTRPLGQLGASPLRLTTPDEPEEIEADRFANAALDALARAVPAAPALGSKAPPSPASPVSAPALPPPVAEVEPAPREAAEREEVLDEPKRAGVSAAAADAGGGEAGDAAQGDDAVDRLLGAGAGAPLGAAVRERIEPLVGMDLSRVRVHADTEAAALTDRFQARAFAHERDIFFAPGAYAPTTRTGLQLLLHEIAHVVQQSGRAPAPNLIARGPLSGRAFHKKLEKILVDKHDIIAEGVLPGGNSGSRDEDRIGYPDLYRSSAGKKVPWVMGQTQDDGTLKYVPMKLGKGHPHPRSKGGKKAGHEPTVDEQGTFTGDFPERFAVAEIKPVGFRYSGLAKAGEGLDQANNYLLGFPNFAEGARKAGKSKVVPKGSSLGTEKGFLPPEIDYMNFETEGPKKKPDAPAIVGSGRRYWVYALHKAPVLFYFDLPHPYAINDYTKALDQLFAELEGLTRRLGKKQKATKQKLSGKSAVPGGGGRRRRRVRVARKTDWKAEHKVWEADREAWDTKKAKPFLKTKESKALEEKADVDKKLGRPATEDQPGRERNRKLKQVERFSGKSGKILGDIRYLLAPIFDKITPFFEWLNKKLSALVKKLRGSRSLSLSWAQTIFDSVLKALGTTVQEAVALLFGMFQDCIMGIVDTFIESFAQDLGEKLHEPFENAKTAFLAWLGTDEATLGKLAEDVEASLKKYEDIVDTVMDVTRLVNEIKIYEVAIRGIVQIISCVSPPLLGCLWGAVAQLALPAIVGLAMKSDLFQDRVVRPLVRDLVKDILDEPFSRIVSASVEAIGLKEWGQKVPACKIKPIDVKKILDEALGSGLKVDDPEMLKAREEWRKKNEGALLDAALKQFARKDGKPVTKEEIKKLMDNIDHLLPGAGGMKDALERAKRKDGKIDFDKFAEWAQGKVAANPRPSGGGGGWSVDGGGSADAATVKKKLDGLGLSNVVPPRLIELVEDSREDDGTVNVDQLARKVKMHLERQQLKKDVEAKHPDRPGVPKQPTGPQFVDDTGAEASEEAMQELVDTLAKENLGETAGAEKIEAARREDGKVDVKAVKDAIEAARVEISPDAPVPTTPPAETDPKPGGEKGKPGKDKPGKGDEQDCTGPLCLDIGPSDSGSGGFRIGPLDVGPKVFEKGPDQDPNVGPGITIPFGSGGAKKKKR